MSVVAMPPYPSTTPVSGCSPTANDDNVSMATSTAAARRASASIVAVFSQSSRCGVVGPDIRLLRLNDMLARNLDDEIRRPDLPRVVVRELDRRRHVGRAAPRSPGVNPAGDRRDLVVTQRGIVLEMADADAAINEPRRHLASRDPLFDSSCLRPHIVV
jgi:hypothetical protein